MCPLNVTMPQAGCCVAERAGVWGRIDLRVGIGAGAPACLRRQACLCPPNETCYRTPGAKRVRNFASSGGGLHVRLRHHKKIVKRLSHRFVHHAMAKQLPLS